ncbi:spore protease YyaC [Paenibacillus turpanensis]|uniref:spore protease YyaC n=1 Tax=Paenibacillus turpanensis TaxID=2689078 RepID=UPI00140DBE34|nr:spore protease YyaC [Paenibacillus turpanensis]
MNFSFPFTSKKTFEPMKVLHSEPNSLFLISNQLQTLFQNVPAEREIVIVCVGTDRSTGDALGPLVGSRLEKKGYTLFGTLDEPVHAMNLAETITTLQQRYHNPYVVAIDACLGQLASIGCIQIGEGPVKPGAGVHKELPPVGDIHVTGIVNVGGFMEYFVLQNTRLNLVVKMADLIADSLHLALSSTRRYSVAKA